MGKLPYFPFFVADWKNDLELQSCSIAARGLWIELLCIMHKATPYGYLQINSNPISDIQVALMVGTPFDLYIELKEELLLNQVPGVSPEGALYSRRMVRDDYIRKIRSEAGSKGGNPQLTAKKDKLVKQKGSGLVKQKPNQKYEDEDESANEDEYDINSEPYKLSKLLLDLIQQNFPKVGKKADLQKWAYHIDLMNRIDKIPYEEIEQLIRWCQQNDFWKKNILGTEKLRMQYDQLTAKMAKGSNHTDRTVQVVSKWLEENTQEAMPLPEGTRKEK